jgi:hypothetical protein
MKYIAQHLSASLLETSNQHCIASDPEVPSAGHWAQGTYGVPIYRWYLQSGPGLAEPMVASSLLVLASKADFQFPHPFPFPFLSFPFLSLFLTRWH